METTKMLNRTAGNSAQTPAEIGQHLPCERGKAHKNRDIIDDTTANKARNDSPKTLALANPQNVSDKYKLVKINKLSFLTVLCSIFIGCKENVESYSSQWNYDSIQHQNELFLIQTDDRFGEWGGNTYCIRAYRDKNTKQILLDYKEYQGKTEPPPPPNIDSLPTTVKDWFSGQPILKEKIGILATEDHLKEITNAIQELLGIKINNSQFVTMSGVINRVMYSDSSLIIEDYPSTNWDKFQSLKNIIEKE